MKYKNGDLVRIVSCNVNPCFVGRNGVVVKALLADVPLYKVMVSGETITDYATEDCLEALAANSLWHSMSEPPIKGENIIIECEHSFYGIVLRRGGSRLKNENMTKYKRWCYVKDLLNI